MILIEIALNVVDGFGKYCHLNVNINDMGCLSNPVMRVLFNPFLCFVVFIIQALHLFVIPKYFVIFWCDCKWNLKNSFSDHSLRVYRIIHC